MKLLSRDGDAITYEADFWEGPLTAEGVGKRVKRKCCDQIVDRIRFDQETGKTTLLGRKLLSAAPSVSYYGALEKALGIKWGMV